MPSDMQDGSAQSGASPPAHNPTSHPGASVAYELAGDGPAPPTAPESQPGPIAPPLDASPQGATDYPKTHDHKASATQKEIGAGRDTVIPPETSKVSEKQSLGHDLGPTLGHERLGDTQTQPGLGHGAEPGFDSDEPPPYESYEDSRQYPVDGFPADDKPPALPPRPVPGAAAPTMSEKEAGPSTTTPVPATSSAPGPAGPSKSSWGDRLAGWATKASGPVNKLTNKLGSEAFWPAPMDQECDKAARILYGFCTGFYSSPPQQKQQQQLETGGASTPPPPEGAAPAAAKRNRVLVRIPKDAIANARGVAIFTTLRGGFHLTGAAGSGLVMARLADGSWSPPSGFVVTAAGAGFVAGLDIYDCVCVLNTPEAVATFTRPRWSLGGDISATAGPLGGGAALDAALVSSSSSRPTSSGDGHERRRSSGGKNSKGVECDHLQKDGQDGGASTPAVKTTTTVSRPVWSYVKSRGLYLGAQVDGTAMHERADANAAFYGGNIPVDRILKGEVPRPWPAARALSRLFEVLKLADGRGGTDDALLREVAGDNDTAAAASSKPSGGAVGLDGTQGSAPGDKKEKNDVVYQ